MNVAGRTDVGQSRTQNQDAIFISTEAVGPLPNLFIVADGMGGHNAGEVASSQAVDLVAEYISNFQMAELVLPDNYLDLLVTAVQEANAAVYLMSEDDSEMHGMGTTFTACVITDDRVLIAHVGDSRAYAVSPLGISQLTADHTYVEQMVQAGQLTVEEARNHPKRHMITRVIGMQGLLEVDGLVFAREDISAILLCSDGLSNMLDDRILLEIINGPGLAESRIETLVEEANLRGGHDNISAILIDVMR